MFRYVAFLWDETKPGVQETARRLKLRQGCRGQGWSEVLAQEGFYVACSGVRKDQCEPYRLHGGQGVLLGKLFERAPESGASGQARPMPLRLDEESTRQLLRGQGRGLVEGFWGRYVALWRDTEGTHVLRDPSSGLPCLTLTYGGVTVVFSSVEDVLDLGLPPFEVSWDFICASICQVRQHTHGTALKQVFQVLGGERMSLHRGPGQVRLTRTFLWDAVQIACEDPVEDVQQATALVRGAVREAVQAWGGSYSGILLSLSSGLDSSIVLACLKDAPSRGKLVCFHYFPQGKDLDERVGARQLARDAGLLMIERGRDSQLSLKPLLELRLSHQPEPGYLYSVEHCRLDAELAREHGATVIFTGWGGDQLFYQDHGVWAAADYAWRHPFSPGIWRHALDCARMDRLSVWQVLKGCMGPLSPRHDDPRRELLSYRQLLAPEVVKGHAQTLAFQHPLMRHTRKVPPGKLWHLQQLLAGGWDFYDPLSAEDDPDRMPPLYSQPVLEACLRICTHTLVEGGWSRAVARRAFKQDLPGFVINRQHKGTIEDHTHHILRHNIALVRELLLDGELVKQGMLVRTRLEQALSGNVNRLQTGRVELLQYLGIEAWLKAWQGRQAPSGGHDQRAQLSLSC